MERVAVVLSGCGYLDGAEITEAVSVLIALDEAGIGFDCYAPDRPQHHVIDHLHARPVDATRNCLTEAARIARGRIAALSRLDTSAYRAVVFPGGFGVAKNLCDFAVAGGQAQLADDVRLILQAFSVAKKPVLALCAAPLLLGLYARDTGLRGARLTVGAGGEPLAEALNAWGQTHVPCAVDQPCIDPAQRWITVPAYMDAHATPRQIFSAARAGVAALCEVLG